ncbi:CLUMA_CG001102, isoform A [Clunio marinus]|uniref:CLUMA_CG001102, isoform A n=1 Tax=Clunio marinus TaxID=568069 RepID=A0A1J1HIS0_9DIPT|nr:CLUMA_CG001102, isoform A [Clunio marinus]
MQTPVWINEIIETSGNKSRGRASENVLLNGLAQLEISSPENIMTYITHESPCKKLKPYVNAFKRYRHNLPSNSLYVRLFKAVEKFRSIYCTNEDKYRRIFLQHQDELISLHEQFADCDGKPDWYENMNASNLCEDAKNILNCYEDALCKEVGCGVAEAWSFIFQQIMNETLIRPCDFPSKQIKFPFDISNDSVVGFTHLNAMFILLTVIAIIYC